MAATPNFNIKLFYVYFGEPNSAPHISRCKRITQALEPRGHIVRRLFDGKMKDIKREKETIIEVIGTKFSFVRRFDGITLRIQIRYNDEEICYELDRKNRMKVLAKLNKWAIKGYRITHNMIRNYLVKKVDLPYEL